MKILFIIIAMMLVCSTLGETQGLFKVLKDSEKKKFKPGEIEILKSDRAPKPIGSYNIGTKLHHDGYSMIITAGQIGLDPATGQLVEGLEAQIEQAMKNLEAIIVDNGGSLDKVLRTQLFLSDMANFSIMDKIYAKYFTTNFPARAAVAVKDLPKYCFFEIMAEAVAQE